MSRRRGPSSPRRPSRREKMRAAKNQLAVVGEQLLAIRDTARYRDEGFSTFEEYCEQAVPAMVPDWDLGVTVAEVIAAAVVAAERKRAKAPRARGVSGE